MSHPTPAKSELGSWPLIDANNRNLQRQLSASSTQCGVLPTTPTTTITTNSSMGNISAYLSPSRLNSADSASCSLVGGGSRLSGTSRYSADCSGIQPPPTVAGSGYGSTSNRRKPTNQQKPKMRFSLAKERKASTTLGN